MKSVQNLQIKRQNVIKRQKQQYRWRRPGIFIVNSEHISHIVLLLPLSGGILGLFMERYTDLGTSYLGTQIRKTWETWG